MQKTIIFTSGILVGLLLALFLYFFNIFGSSTASVSSDQNSCNSLSESNYTETREPGYELIKPLLECNVGHEFPSISPLEEQIETYLTTHDLSQRSSVYFRNLDTGAWIGIRETQKTAPASLVKVLIAMAVYKKAEVDPQLLGTVITYNEEFKANRNIESNEFALKKGEQKTIEELLERMLFYSDNEAADILSQEINTKYPGFLTQLQKSFNFDSGGYISFMDYSNLFRFLYNASYLSRKSSEKLLDTLTNVNFQDGIVKPIPEGVKVAQKFGYFDPKNSLELKLFNHCGIFYLPENPYLLCVMIRTQDNSGSELQNAITHAKDISEIVYLYLK